MIEYAANWRAASACLNTDPDMFFPVAAGKQTARALRICHGCPVRQQCLDFAMQSGEKDGIWGGTTPEQRIRARRRHSRGADGTWRAALEIRAS